MKVAITGCTGLVGGEVLRQCRQHSAVTSIVALTRRALSDEITNDPKVTVVMMKDFKRYGAEALAALDGADACIWALGGISAVPETELEYPSAFANAIKPSVIKHKKPFRYLHTSGALAVPDQTKSLWFLTDVRRTKGQGENLMTAFEKDESLQGIWTTYLVRPAMITPAQRSFSQTLTAGMLGGVRVNELAACMIETVIKGGEKKVFDNAELVERGRMALVNK